MAQSRDHGGGIDAAALRFGGTRADWIDLSTGINPVPYPLPTLKTQSWTDLPDQAAHDTLVDAARRFWCVPKDAMILPAPGASALIARLPALASAGRVDIPSPTYNEHAAAFRAHGWQVSDETPDARVIVHPNNPTGRWYSQDDLAAPLTVVDESFADVAPDRSLARFVDRAGIVVLKSFGKFWGLAGLRLGFAIAAPDTIARLSDLIGPWPVSGPALEIGAAALTDTGWAEATRTRLNEDAARLDALMARAGARSAGGTSLFRLYDVDSATRWQDRLAEHRIWSRIFPYSDHWLRLGLPGPDSWHRLETAL